MGQAENFKAQILRERERVRDTEQRRERPVGLDFDPFEPSGWKVLTDGNPGYLPRTPMREGRTGFHIHCKACNAEFESKGWAYCPSCMALPAEERHAMRPVVIGRMCQAPGCENRISRQARAGAIYCSKACGVRAYRTRRVTDKSVLAPDSTPPENVTDNDKKDQ